ncbi:hypothetical protein ASPWEDRAFT_504966 [Aspergillus wentii DTO 134E9]|uniref:SH3 domain-containing protein n=1 Tax=Aspergillus wentii DTO 134E9 TaxID=1073089 RepID=A0A1L9RK43_ASPWE|nr:uncharacterized protein ASPWEDRAFT_504966 [Aspergillus wentii DTO 134E9]OJJ35300.1 hypothetical protein ASPWEDRAFT_504966 [Aspergillus wentii DTO 134E9]
MTRPQIVRADTIDLQDQHAPSAKDHTNQNINPAPVEGGLAPHQEQSIRHAVRDSSAEISHGPDFDEDEEYGDRIDIYHDTEDIDGNHRSDTGGSSEDGDLADVEGDDLMDDDMMDKISSSPSIDDEDIDFEFVYALHNFVATVEGQANAAKGDTMVLLDDSNSYWWLVRIVKDGSIGYLPAEHIETPTERLARLNKHRNVDLSATMLGDNSEKSKNPLKKAMRRRNAKTVAFTAPTYIEASDVEYSTDEELEDGDFFDDDEETIERDDVDLQDGQNEDIVVEPLRPKPQREKGAEEPEDQHEAGESDRASPEKQRSSEELNELEENTPSRSRNGTVRNTDSFFKDDSVETKKISLTPNLLRDESSNAEAKEERISFEAIDKALSANDKLKEDKKRKDKKPGMLSGLFKRKDKKSKTAEEEVEEPEKVSGENSRSSPQPKTSSESVSSPESRSTKIPGPQKQSGKLQKQPPGAMSPTKRDMGNDEAAPTSKGRADRSIRQVVPEEADELHQVSTRLSDDVRETISSPTGPTSPTSPTSPVKESSSAFINALASPTGSNNGGQRPGPFDRVTPTQHSVTSPPQRFQPKPRMEHQGRSLESPIDVSPLETHNSGAPGLAMDLSSPGGRSESPASPPMSPFGDVNEIKVTEANRESLDNISANTPTWSDASLRSYLDDDNDIRDLFIIVHDKSNVPPAGPEHPITGSLFKEESKRLKEMTSQLDGMLSQWVHRRKPNSATI